MNWKKRILIFLPITIVVALALSFFVTQFLKYLGEAFGENCNLVDTFYVKNYKIEESECIGWAGPKYDSYKLYENGRHLSAGLLKQDTCQFYFSHGNDTLLRLDSCKQTVEFFLPEKRNLVSSEIDSVVIFKTSDSIKRKLNAKEIMEFVIRWNNSISDGAQNPDREWYPPPKYLIEVFTKNEIRKFKTSHITIQEKGSFWNFNILDKGEDRTTQKFDKIFNMID
jgi:hypothetical protein